MLVQLNKAELTIEQTGMCSAGAITELKTDNLLNVTSEDVQSLHFEGFTGFNANYAEPLLKLFKDIYLNKSVGTFKTISVIGNLYNDELMHEADFFLVKNTRDTAFLFKTLKSLSINLPELRLGYSINELPITLYLDRKIINVLRNLDESQRKDLVFYFYCLARFFKAASVFYKSHIFQGALGDASTVNIDAVEFNKLYREYGKLEEKCDIECIQLKEDVFFGEVMYLNTDLMKLPNPDIELKFTSKYVYNVIRINNNEKLCIINVSTKEYFVIDLGSYTVYTNNELKEYNTFEITEWMPNLISNIKKVCPESSYYRLKFLTLDKLLSSKEPVVTISNDASRFEDLLELYPDVTENTDMKLYAGYFKGCKVEFDGGANNLESQYVNDAYAQQLYKQKQAYYDTFELKDLTQTVKGVANGAIYSMLFEGESGTGKSTAARVIASRCGLPFVAINCSTNIEESDIFGSMIPNPSKSSADDAEFIWQDGPLTKAIRYGYMGIIEELGFGRPGVLGKINSLLDESRQIDLPNGEVLKAHPNFRIIATTNIGYEGTNRLNKALVNRFEVCKKFVDLDEKEAKSIIMSRTGYSDVNKITKVLDVYRSIKKYSNEQSLGLVVSIRQLLNIFKQGKYYKSAEDAIRNLLINQAFLEEPEHREHFITTILNAFDLNFKI